jgi:hypothetical protein
LSLLDCHRGVGEYPTIKDYPKFTTEARPPAFKRHQPPRLQTEMAEGEQARASESWRRREMYDAEIAEEETAWKRRRAGERSVVPAQVVRIVDWFVASR